MEYVEYIDKTEYVILYRMYGSGAIAEIPASVAGRPVRMLADHLFANEPSALYPKSQIMRAVFNGTQYVEAPEYGSAAGTSDGDEPALAGVSLEIIRIPEGVEGIGNYAFYGCFQLREISFPSTMTRIGYGMFNGCRQVCRLYFAQDPSDRDSLNPSVMKEVLDAVTNQIEAVVTRDDIEQWRLTFPDYYEEGKENTPARIIDIVYHGTGYKYRNCFMYRQIQFEKYDAVFPFAAAQESASVCISIIRSRLRSGPEPKEEWKYRYIDYLRSEKELLIDTILADTEFDPVGELEVLDSAGYFTSSIIDVFIGRASDRKRSDAVSFLMDVKRRRFAPQRKSKYEL
ncbi:MAG: leucine-rich repeat domain-containing protein [Lachnospiraceae bacterium]|nr:leucine-rich repeat domain-containing protein [Lachnospiraceae bacterium]